MVLATGFSGGAYRYGGSAVGSFERRRGLSASTRCLVSCLVVDEARSVRRGARGLGARSPTLRRSPYRGAAGVDRRRARQGDTAGARALAEWVRCLPHLSESRRAAIRTSPEAPLSALSRTLPHCIGR